MILAVDPGNTHSALVVWDGGKIWLHNKLENDQFRFEFNEMIKRGPVEHVACEMIASYGMSVGRTVFETCVFIGNLEQLARMANVPFDFVYRMDVKMHLCHSPRAKDGNIRQALIDRFGEPGTKKNQGFTYGLTKDRWAAFAVAVYYHDKMIEKVAV